MTLSTKSLEEIDRIVDTIAADARNTLERHYEIQERAAEEIKDAEADPHAAPFSAHTGPLATKAYESCAETMKEVTRNAFDTVAGGLGVTGFQASWAAGRFYAEAMDIKSPFMIVKADDWLYPQYDHKVSDWLNSADVKAHLKNKALTMLGEDRGNFPIAETVDARLKSLALTNLELKA